MKIGVITDCFKKSHFDGIKLASKLGLSGVQIYATTGEFSPKTLTKEEKDIILNYFTQLGFVIEFQELVTEKIPVYWFNVSWKHLL